MGRSSGRSRGIHECTGKYLTSSKEKAKSGLSKSLGNSMFTYEEKKYAKKYKQNGKMSSNTLEFLLAKTLVCN